LDKKDYNCTITNSPPPLNTPTIITKVHCRGSEESHNKKKCAKVKGIEKMIQQEFDREMTEIKGKLNYMMKLLQEEEIQENHIHGWSMKKKFQWPLMQLHEEILWKRLEEVK
jgi:hypothetical protein